MADMVDLSGDQPKIIPDKTTPIDLMVSDLAQSGLVYSDMRTRPLDEATRQTCGIPSTVNGYVIPYYDILGKPIHHYRCKLIDHHVKYVQPKSTPNYVYFPPNFWEVFCKYKQKVVVFTEGEKKAALACKMGIPCVGFGGVDSWNNRSIQIPKIAEITTGKQKGLLNVKLPSTNLNENFLSVLATGMQQLIDLCLQNKTMVFICYDTDTPNGVAVAVQKSAARLGLELRFKGLTIGNIRQIVLPHLESERDGAWEESPGDHKTSLDTYLLDKNGGGAENFWSLLHATKRKRLAFPRHPAIREYVATRLQKKFLERKEWQNLAISVICELDSIGARMYSPNNLQMYYFDALKHHLMKVNLNRPNPAALNDEEFGKLLYQVFSISASADSQLMKWLSTQFSGEDPVIEVEPHRLIAKPRRGEDIVRFQINNGEYVQVDADGFKVMANGASGILFESDFEDPIPGDLMTEWLTRISKQKLANWWLDVLSEVRLKYQDKKQAKIISYLYCISPFLYGWRGLQLPVEMIIGEAGSGKSTLAEIRLKLITGDPHLRNTPDSIKDWYASLSNVGGIHITDNVHLTDKNFKQRVSDELCRLVTDPEPRIEMRKYFTEADQRIIKINSVFGFTAIQQPFQNQDIIQRSIILELEKGEDASFDAHWKDRQIEKYGGRAAWLAWHMIVLRDFFKLVKEKWDHKYQARHRLVNLEQSLMLIAEVLGDPEKGKWIPDYLANTTMDTIIKNDYVLEGLADFVSHVRVAYKQGTTFTAAEICDWMKSQDEHKNTYNLTNSRSLGRYLQLNKSMIAARVGLVDVKNMGNKMYYGLIKKDERVHNKALHPLHEDNGGRAKLEGEK